jgi:hypothetical protein
LLLKKWNFLMLCLIYTKYLTSLLLKMTCSKPYISKLSIWHVYNLTLKPLLQLSGQVLYACRLCFSSMMTLHRHAQYSLHRERSFPSCLSFSGSRCDQSKDILNNLVIITRITTTLLLSMSYHSHHMQCRVNVPRSLLWVKSTCKWDTKWR